MNQKRCLTIQDYSCMGRCSLTVALPILSACQIEAVGLPTAILSNHTAFDSWTYVDLTAQMKESVRKWKNYNHHFDCIYTGYLGTKQIPEVIDIIRKLKKDDTMVMVDPAFGDNGKMYPGFSKEHIVEMKKLLAVSNISCPNLTEAFFLLGKEAEYREDGLSDKELYDIAKELSILGPKTILLTGTIRKQGNIGCTIYDRESDTLSFYDTECYPGKYHGAGDSYCSALVGTLLNDIPLYDSVRIAHDFVHESMKYNLDNKVDGLLYGLQFERALPDLIRSIEKENKK